MRIMTSHLLYSSRTLILILALSSSLAFPAERTVGVIDVGHAQLNIEVWKSNAKDFETIIALPGSGDDVSRYKYIAPLPADAGYRVVAVNQRGVAGSTGELGGLSLHDYAADVAAVIDVLDLQKVHLLGWAVGNRPSRVVATDFPDKVASISLIPAGGLVRALTEPCKLGRLLGEADIPEAEKVQLARRTLFSPDTSYHLVSNYVRELKYWPDARRSQGQADRNMPLQQWWTGGSGPMLIVQGEDDKTAPPENCRRMKQEFAERITLVNLKGAEHLMGLEKPRETADGILSFLAKHPITTMNQRSESL